MKIEIQENMGPADSEPVYRFFRSLKTDILKKWEQKYELLLGNEVGKFTTGYHPITHKGFGHIRMPWMIPAWRQGLEILKTVIAEREHPINDIRS